MLPSLVALGLLGQGSAFAQEPAPAAPDQADLSDDIAAFLGEDTATAASTAPPPPAPVPSSSPNAFNPRITAFADFLTTVGVDSGGVMPGSGPWVRSFELDIRADVDPFAKAVAIIPVEQEQPDLRPSGTPNSEPPSFAISPEELYIDLVALPGGLSSRVGQQKLPFGLTNRMHAHDWPWPDAPLPFAAVMGDGGMSDVAATLAWRVATPGAGAFTVTGAALAGTAFDPSGLDASPGWLGRAEYFGTFGDLQLGLGASSTGQSNNRADGTDLMLRWRKDSWHSIVLIAEGFRSVKAGVATPFGWTSTLQLQPTRPFYIGLRLDELAGAWQYAGYVSYYTTEFLRLRLGATTDLDTVTGNAQLTVVWGSHPTEPYWVNQ
ncbi:MAG: hypothetical protein GXP62_19475 [Oligoflexia bacterium]|nr:hypothetical protein [Oligoflexia bacterium]